MASAETRRDGLLQAEDHDREGLCTRTRRRLCCGGGAGRPQTQDEARVLVRQDTLDAPFSQSNELRFFVVKGLPLCLANLFNWGLPSLFSMVMAGHTANSAELQAAFGFARVWYNVTCVMPMVSMIQYSNYLLPIYIGAGRRDRVPLCLWRGFVLSSCVMLPMYVLQFTSGPILRYFGVPATIAGQVDIYNRIMVITSVMNIVEMHLGTLVTQNGYARSMTMVSICGAVVQMTCSYLFLYSWAWGMVGNALAQVAVRVARISAQALVVFCGSDLWKQLVCPRRAEGGGGAEPAPQAAGTQAEPFMSRQVVAEFVSLTSWGYLANLAGWLIFELQMMILANIANVPAEALAAGSVWVQMESAFASSQEGWLACINMRVLRLLGQQDLGAKKAFWLLEGLCDVIVGACNIGLVIFQAPLCRMISNDPGVQMWLGRILWVLVIHTQTRIGNLNAANLCIPLKRGRLRALITFVGFYVVASPLAGLVALTDVVTTSISTKLVACVGLSSIAQAFNLLCLYVWVCRLDWQDACHIVKAQADSDRQKDSSTEAASTTAAP